MKDGSIARAVASFMLRLTAGLLSVLTVKFVVRNALDRRRNLVVVVLDAMPTVATSQKRCEEAMSRTKYCTACKKARESRGLLPKELKRLPPAISHVKTFNNKGIPILLCEDCDGPALESALEAHQKRTRNK
jgi:hypothetical protein